MTEQSVKPQSDRRFWKTVLLSILTLGIYAIIFYTRLVRDLNTIASPYDGKKTMHYCKMLFLLAIPTVLIFPIIWTHRLSARIGRELRRRELPYNFGAKTFWGWNVLGLFILVGPFIYLHKLCRAMNLISVNYNING